MSKKFLLYWLPAVLWAILIFALSSVSKFPEEIEPLFSFSQVVHLLEYAILAFLLARAFKHSDKEKLIRNFRILAVAAAILYGLSDEFHQSFVPYRTPDAIDWLIDCVGALLGQMFLKT